MNLIFISKQERGKGVVYNSVIDLDRYDLVTKSGRVLLNDTEFNGIIKIDEKIKNKQKINHEDITILYDLCQLSDKLNSQICCEDLCEMYNKAFFSVMSRLDGDTFDCYSYLLLDILKEIRENELLDEDLDMYLNL